MVLKFAKKNYQNSKIWLKGVFLFQHLDNISSNWQYTLDQVYTKSINYVESLRFKEKTYGQYRYINTSQYPLLYASVFAALFRHLVGDLNQLTVEERQQWIDYINSYQCEDGLFRDPLVTNEISEIEDWWGWRHLTPLSLMALNALNSKPKYALNFLEKIDTPAKVRTWLDNLNWRERVSFTSNTVQNYGVSLQYARDFLGESGLNSSIQELLTGVSERCYPSTGLWGEGIENPQVALSEGVQAGYHFWLLYWYEGLSIPYPDKVLESIIKLQNRFGGFDLTKMYSSACQDIDSLYPLVKLAIDYSCFETTAISVVKKSLSWLLYNFNYDGGACFIKNDSFCYGHHLMLSEKNESSIFATWFRMLTIAYCCELLKKQFNDLDKYSFFYLNCPGLQYSLYH